VAISPQSISSMSLFFSQTQPGSISNDLDTFKKLQDVFFGLGAQQCVNLSVFTRMSLDLAYREFTQQFSKTEKFNQLQASEKQEETKQASSSKFYKKGSGMPLISSECPGWVCYAEKRVGDLALPNMSQTKSPQQLFGTLARLAFLKKHPEIVSVCSS
jgi:iron only hydrogenase large subunit-like protein